MRKNKVLKIFIAILLLISIQTSVIATTKGVVNTDTVRIREKSTTNSDIVGLISIGNKVTILGEENGWYKVNCKDDHGENVEGYIRKDLLTVDKGAVIPSDETEEPTDNDTATGDKTTPTEQPEVTGSTAGQEGPTEENPNDKPTEDGKSAGGEQSNEGETAGTQKPNVGITVETMDKTISTLKIAGGVSAGKKVQLTEETKIKILPSANSSNIAKLNANTEVTVLEVINSWCRIEAGEYVGWVRIDQ